MLELPIHRATRFVLVSPHYPENLGAACRALKTMGFVELGLVRPGRLAHARHEEARRMAVKSTDVLDRAIVFENLDEAIVGFDLVVATSARSGVSGIIGPRALAERATDLSLRGKRVAVVFGNEKTGLSNEELGRADAFVRIPMAAPQPSINLAQAVQLLAYQLFQVALDRRDETRSGPRAGADQ